MILPTWVVMSDLTDIQRRVFEFVRNRLGKGLPAPTLREIAADFGWSSKGAAAFHKEAIIRKGWLSSEPGKARSLRLAKPLSAAPAPTFEVPLYGSISAGFGHEREQ